MAKQTLPKPPDKPKSIAGLVTLAGFWASMAGYYGATARSAGDWTLVSLLSLGVLISLIAAVDAHEKALTYHDRLAAWEKDVREQVLRTPVGHPRNEV